MLNAEMQKKVECFLSKCSNIVTCDKMLMKTAHTVFSTVHVHERVQEICQSLQEKRHMCEICSNFFDSLYKQVDLYNMQAKHVWRIQLVAAQSKAMCRTHLQKVFHVIL